MSKMLNLDDLVQEERVVTIGGKSHVMKEMSVEDFIVLSSEAEKLDESAPMSEQVDMLVKMICRSFPTMEETALRKLPLRHLQAIMDFARETGEEGAEQGKE